MMTLFSFAVPLLVLVLLLAVQPLILKFACSVCGVDSPRFSTALGVVAVTFLVGSLASLLYGFTLGMLLAAISPPLSGLVGAVLVFGVSAVCYSALLRLPLPKALGVALVQHVGSWAVLLMVGASLRPLL